MMCRFLWLRLLKPLGNPLPNSIKYFATSELLEQVQDRAWLAKVTNALNQHWRKRNSAKNNFSTGIGDHTGSASQHDDLHSMEKDERGMQKVVDG